jgi:hypothetical protein
MDFPPMINRFWLSPQSSEEKEKNIFEEIALLH